MSGGEQALEKLRAQQGQVERYSAPWMVAEQLMDLCRREPAHGELIAQDLDNPEMGIVMAAAQLQAYADAHHGKAKTYCITPAQAEEILRQFYGLPDRGTEPAAGVVLDLADFFG